MQHHGYTLRSEFSCLFSAPITLSWNGWFIRWISWFFFSLATNAESFPPDFMDMFWSCNSLLTLVFEKLFPTSVGRIRKQLRDAWVGGARVASHGVVRWLLSVFQTGFPTCWNHTKKSVFVLWGCVRTRVLQQIGSCIWILSNMQSVEIAAFILCRS